MEQDPLELRAKIRKSYADEHAALDVYKRQRWDVDQLLVSGRMEPPGLQCLLVLGFQLLGQQYLLQSGMVAIWRDHQV